MPVDRRSQRHSPAEAGDTYQGYMSPRATLRHFSIGILMPFFLAQAIASG